MCLLLTALKQLSPAIAQAAIPSPHMNCSQKDRAAERERDEADPGPAKPSAHHFQVYEGGERCLEKVVNFQSSSKAVCTLFNIKTDAFWCLIVLHVRKITGICIVDLVGDWNVVQM